MITVFLPCRKGSQRVVGKNTRAFGDRQDGLLGIKLEQLVNCAGVDKILVSTNDEIVANVASKFPSKVQIDWRREELCSSSTSTDELVSYVPEIIKSGHVMWTHVTSPFFGTSDYDRALETYLAAFEAGSHDSLMTVTRLQTFIWDANGPINYDRNLEKWPRTQTLPSYFEINSALFLIPVDLMMNIGDRIGKLPLLYETEKYKSVDVDWQDDFELASRLFKIR